MFKVPDKHTLVTSWIKIFEIALPIVTDVALAYEYPEYVLLRCSGGKEILVDASGPPQVKKLKFYFTKSEDFTLILVSEVPTYWCFVLVLDLHPFLQIIYEGNTPFGSAQPSHSASTHYAFSLYINYGGSEVWITETKYPGADDDTKLFLNRHRNYLPDLDQRGASLFRLVSPLSLTYYGMCLSNGEYLFRLHFTEIVFSDDKSFSSLGRRIFDVYIQENLVLKDFDIAKEAGVYYIPPSPSSPSPPRVVFIFVSFLVLRRKCSLGGKLPEDKELKGLDLLTGLFTLRQIEAATNNFDPSNKLGEGGFGAVYKGLLSDGTGTGLVKAGGDTCHPQVFRKNFRASKFAFKRARPERVSSGFFIILMSELVIAVKQLSTKFRQGSREFVNEIGMNSSLQHPNLVKLYGCCAEGNQLLVVYDYMENNCLWRALFGRDTAMKWKLDCPTRQKICLGIARGSRYLHEESILNDGDDTHISTRIAGTFGYMAPEYAMRGYLTSKADVNVKYGNQVAAEELNNLNGDSRAQGFGPEVRTLVQASFKSALAENDILISPSSLQNRYDVFPYSLAMYAGDIMTVNVPLAGLPALVLPCGFVDQMIGAAFKEEKL
ncbi:unnamed protein product [Rhodiola kirilowii]